MYIINLIEKENEIVYIMKGRCKDESDLYQ